MERGMKCLRCGHEWEKRVIAEPIQCPRCKSVSWNKSRKKIVNNKIRMEIIKKYGGKCVWCGSRQRLVLDHVNEDGPAQRASGVVQERFWRWIKENDYPETIQVLCHACNIAKSLVHKKEKEAKYELGKKTV